MSVGVDHLLRSARAESIRTSGRSPLWMILVPAATVLPAGITFGIAYIAERFAGIPGQQYLQEVGTSNAAYWVITITAVMTAVAAALGQSYESRCGAREYVHSLLPRRWTVLGGTWLFYGALGALGAVVTVVVVLVGLPHLSPSVYGQVSVSDPVALRLLWTVPVFSFFAAGMGTGIGAICRAPAAGVGLILFWVYVVETAVGYLPGGLGVQRFMPFLNGVYATGQDIVLEPPWGPNPALAFVCAVFAVVFACGLCTARTEKGIHR